MRKQGALQTHPAIQQGERSMHDTMRATVVAVRAKDTSRGKRTTVDVSLIIPTAPTTPGAQERVLTHVPLLYENMADIDGAETPPVRGAIAIVSFIGGNLRDPVVLGFMAPYDGKVMPADNDALNRSYRTKNGTSEKIDKDGNRTIVIKGDQTVTVQGDKYTLTMSKATAEFSIAGSKIALGGDFASLKKLIDERFIELFNNHVHLYAGAGTPSPPTVPITAETCTTTKTKAG